MPPRTILYTGKGGVGKTSVAAASALRCAAAGLRTLVVSTDPAHSLGDSLGHHLHGRPASVGEHLWAQQVSIREQLEGGWSATQAWLGELLRGRGVDPISAAELTAPPGLEELLQLLALREHHRSDAYEILIVDCAPTAEALRLLAFPDVARWWLQRLLPAQGHLLGAARPLAKAMLDISLPGDAVLEEIHRLIDGLVELNAILEDHEHVTIRLVTSPEQMVIAETRRTFTYLNLYGYLTDAVIVNRVFPADVGPYFDGWRSRQQEQLSTVSDAFAPIPVLRAPFFEQELAGATMLTRLGQELFADLDVAAVLHDRIAHELTSDPHGATLRLELPFSERDAIALKRIGLELIIEVDGHRRAIMLPSSLAEHRTGEARFADGTLTVSFLAPGSPRSGEPSPSYHGRDSLDDR